MTIDIFAVLRYNIDSRCNVYQGEMNLCYFGGGASLFLYLLIPDYSYIALRFYNHYIYLYISVPFQSLFNNAEQRFFSNVKLSAVKHYSSGIFRYLIYAFSQSAVSGFFGRKAFQIPLFRIPYIIRCFHVVLILFVQQMYISAHFIM